MVEQGFPCPRGRLRGQWCPCPCLCSATTAKAHTEERASTLCPFWKPCRSHTHREVIPSVPNLIHNRCVWTKGKNSVCRIKLSKQTALLPCASGAFKTHRKWYCYFCLFPFLCQRPERAFQQPKTLIQTRLLLVVYKTVICYRRLISTHIDYMYTNSGH